MGAVAYAPGIERISTVSEKYPNIEIVVRGLPFEWEQAIIRALVVRLGGQVELSSIELQPGNEKHGLIINPTATGGVRLFAGAPIFPIDANIPNEDG
jgi:hypothetical protein